LWTRMMHNLSSEVYFALLNLCLSTSHHLSESCIFLYLHLLFSQLHTSTFRKSNEHLLKTMSDIGIKVFFEIVIEFKPSISRYVPKKASSKQHPHMLPLNRTTDAIARDKRFRDLTERFSEKCSSLCEFRMSKLVRCVMQSSIGIQAIICPLDKQ
jgi:hypothetical protein